MKKMFIFMLILETLSISFIFATEISMNDAKGGIFTGGIGYGSYASSYDAGKPAKLDVKGIQGIIGLSYMLNKSSQGIVELEIQGAGSPTTSVPLSPPSSFEPVVPASIITIKPSMVFWLENLGAGLGFSYGIVNYDSGLKLQDGIKASAHDGPFYTSLFANLNYAIPVSLGSSTIALVPCIEGGFHWNRYMEETGVPVWGIGYSWSFGLKALYFLGRH